MIDFVQGPVVERGLDSLVLLVGGFGVRVLTPTSAAAAAPEPGQEARLVTYLHIREDALTLYGFATVAERQLFTRLLSVSGIGPRSALAALSTLSVDQLATTIAAGDAKALARIPGIGAKTAARIVLELKGKLPAVEAPPGVAVSTRTGSGDGVHADVVAALQGLGFSASEIATRLAALPRDQVLSSEDALRLALRQSDTP